MPGDPDALLTASRDLDATATGLVTAHEALLARRRALTGAWTGRAATTALARLDGDARQIHQVADAARGAVTPLATYAAELRAAQIEYARGETMLAAALTAAASPGSGSVPAADAARDAAAGAKAAATELMDRAEERAREANEIAARALQNAGTALDGAPTGAAPTDGGTSTLAQVGNAAASLGNAALQNPLSGLAVAGGGALDTAGAVGTVGSVALDLTGVGAAAGIPLGGASAAAIAGGVGIAGAGLIDLARHAVTDDRVTPFQVNARNKDEDLPDTAVGDVLRNETVPGRNDRVREVADDEAVRALAERLRGEGVPYARGSYPGTWVTAADGTQVGLRETSGSGGPTLDLEFPRGESWKVHRKR